METKLQTLKNAAACNDWQKAISIAAKFPRLGKFRNDILDAHTAYTNPRWTLQFGVDLDVCKFKGIQAMKAEFKLPN